METVRAVGAASNFPGDEIASLKADQHKTIAKKICKGWSEGM
jgi:hypothetical protein